MSTVRKIRQRKPRRPLGRLSAIAASCLAISIGIFCGVDPFTIFYRASVCALIVGISVRLIADFIKLANVPAEEARGVR